jgi:hypothetical protein
MTVFLTERLRLRRVDPDSRTDASFLLDLLNQRSFIDNIADRGVRTLEDARRYMLEGPCASYERHGFGLFAVELRDDATLIGLCGLLKRDYFESRLRVRSRRRDARLGLELPRAHSHRRQHFAPQHRVDRTAGETRLPFRTRAEDSRLRRRQSILRDRCAGLRQRRRR